MHRLGLVGQLSGVANDQGLHSLTSRGTSLRPRRKHLLLLAFSEESICCKQARTKTAVFPMPDLLERLAREGLLRRKAAAQLLGLTQDIRAQNGLQFSETQEALCQT